MKKMALAALLFALPVKSLAGGMSGFWIEPTIACAVVGAAAYSSASDNNRQTQGALGCAAGALVFYGINKYYEGKINEATTREIEHLRKVVRQFEEMIGEQSAEGNYKRSYSIKVREIVPAQVLPDGSVIAPTIRERLTVPNENLEVGY